jgi:drug/metabolite transporter (DMT)-like permease
VGNARLDAPRPAHEEAVLSQPISESVQTGSIPNVLENKAARSSAKATRMLVFITLLWGLSFSLMKNWHLASAACPGGFLPAGLTMVVLRMFLALGVLAIFLPWLFIAPSRREFAIGFFLGVINSLGFAFQVTGLAWTSPALSAFVTSLASAWVPLLMFVLFRVSVHRLTLIGLLIGITGAAVLGIQSNPEGTELVFGWGEILTFVSTWFFALVIVLLDRFGRGVESAHFTVAFLAGTGLPALGIVVSLTAAQSETSAWLRWSLTMLQQPVIWRDLGLLTLFCTVLPFHWFNVYQPRVPASRAALIYLLEPVFASIFSLLWGHDSLAFSLIIGGSMILAGNALVEVPGWLRNVKSRTDCEGSENA